ncbi:MAG: hypothetical protein KVP17_003035 [Porospora cf. gigantea B]|uniref:uncharacterized protein n=1 Tax=Porospora cf. gigantea B TaxID=2853592 RepID=UPI003571DDC8|nr:MAG: hypothetical protein KVP17_003035 [Porospora cf. gigantea B]
MKSSSSCESMDFSAEDMDSLFPEYVQLRSCPAPTSQERSISASLLGVCGEDWMPTAAHVTTGEENASRKRPRDLSEDSLSKRHRRSLDDGQGSNSSDKVLKALRDHLTCPVCQDWVLDSCSLDCGHIFCYTCITQWFQQKMDYVCPACNQTAERGPTMCYAVDGLLAQVHRLEEGMSDPQISDERAELVKRAAESQKRKDDEKRLLARIAESQEYVKCMGKQFVDVTSSQWQVKRSQSVLKKIEPFSGTPRRHFCQMMGLTQHWIDCANKDGLRLVLTNLNLRPNGSSRAALARRLSFFCEFG